MQKKAYRASLLRFDSAGHAVFDTDGLLVVGPDASGRQVVLDAGSHADVAPRHAGVAVTHWPGRIIAPGFVDMHIHFPQTDVIGSPADGLLPWLENYTFPHESRFVAEDYSAQVATFFVDELLRNGVTTALTFSTSHPASVDRVYRHTSDVLAALGVHPVLLFGPEHGYGGEAQYMAPVADGGAPVAWPVA